MTELTWRNYPVPGMPYNITGNFGDDYGGYAHRGTDVGVYTGTPVYAPQEGRVVAMLNDGSFGIAVCIEHPGTGWYSLYAHLSRKDVAEGDWVAAGQVIGLSGNTGTSSGPHLHWQVCDSSSFPTDISHSRDAMRVPFEDAAEDEMTSEERSLLLLVASVVGGWTNGKPFDTVAEALPSFETFEAQDQRVLMGLGILNDCLNSVIAAMEAHMMENEPGPQMEEIMRMLLEAREQLRKLPEPVR